MSVRLIPFATLLCIVMMSCANLVMADEPASVPDVTSSAETTPTIQDVPVPLTPEQLERKKKAYIGSSEESGPVTRLVAA